VSGASYSAAIRVEYAATALQQAHVSPADSLVVESPLPGGVSETVRFLMNAVPPWIQIGGVVLGALVAAFVLRFLFLNQSAIRAWLTSRSSTVKVALAAVALLLIVTVGGMGAVTWNHTQHSNDFCTGCHVMNPAFQRFSSAENKHAELSCHDCHQQSIFASARQVYLWVAERPEEIGPHAKVANAVCEACHMPRRGGTPIQAGQRDLRHEWLPCAGGNQHRARQDGHTNGEALRGLPWFYR
jgi:hypothetical protein